jgi:hypothetical protein
MEKGQSFCCPKCNLNPVGPWKRYCPFKNYFTISIFFIKLENEQVIKIKKKKTIEIFFKTSITSVSKKSQTISYSS